jgi:methionine-rich copper-binding protein CopC
MLDLSFDVLLVPRRAPFPALFPAAFLAALLGGCAGNGAGLDANGEPLTAGNGTPPPLTADFQSIQDNVFTPICVPCHSGPAAPQGLQLDATHSYALLVGVPSVEVAGVLRVDPGMPDQSYIVMKLEGAAGIVGGQMPLGEAPLPQSTIDVIRQWIGAGAPAAVAATALPSAESHFQVTVLSPADQAVIAASALRIVVGFNHELDASLVNSTTLSLERLAPRGAEPPSGEPVSAALALARGNPRAVLVSPASPLAPGRYRLSVRGTGGGALADQQAQALERDYVSEFTVDGVR